MEVVFTRQQSLYGLIICSQGSIHISISVIIDYITVLYTFAYAYICICMYIIRWKRSAKVVLATRPVIFNPSTLSYLLPLLNDSIGKRQILLL